MVSKNVQQQSCSAINYLSNSINILAGDDPVPVKFGPKGTHGRRSMGGQGDMSPYFLKWRGRPVFCPPCFLGVDIFELMKAPTPNRKDARFSFHTRRAVQSAIAYLVLIFTCIVLIHVILFHYL